MSIEWPPDEPMWVDVRSMLESGGPRFGDDANFVICDNAPIHTIAVVGKPSRALFDRAVEAAEPRFEVLCQTGNLDWVRSGLVPGWVAENIIMHEHRGLLPPPPAAPPVRRVTADDPLEHLPEKMRREMERARVRHVLFAAFADGTAVSFAYAHRRTSTLADISIDTLAEYRRRGYARAACLHLFHHLASIGLRPTWGAYESNTASLVLAAKLGFERVGTIWSLIPSVA
jgi:RimJ/RimL family protein N-acetyltransferase